MAVEERRIAVLGAGKIGEALVAGLLSSEWRTPGDIVATARRPERLTELHERHGIRTTLSNPDAATQAALVVVAVKPQDIETLLEEVRDVVTPEQTVLSVAAAIPTAAVERRLGNDADEELRAVAIRLPGNADGRDDAALVLEVAELGGQLVEAAGAPQLARRFGIFEQRVATLDHPVGYDAVEGAAVIVALARERDEVLHVLRGLVRHELEAERAEVGRDYRFQFRFWLGQAAG